MHVCAQALLATSACQPLCCLLFALRQTNYSLTHSRHTIHPIKPHLSAGQAGNLPCEVCAGRLARLTAALATSAHWTAPLLLDCIWFACRTKLSSGALRMRARPSRGLQTICCLHRSSVLLKETGRLPPSPRWQDVGFERGSWKTTGGDTICDAHAHGYA